MKKLIQSYSNLYHSSNTLTFMKQYFVYRKFLWLPLYLNMDSEFTHFWTFRSKNATLFTKRRAIELSYCYNLRYQSINN